MAKRLATKYVQTCLRLTEKNMSELREEAARIQLVTKIKVLDNGNHELVLKDPDQMEELILPFERRQRIYEAMGQPAYLCSRKLTEVMRRAISRYKGTAIVVRVYAGFNVVYYYLQGEVVKIVEQRGDEMQLIYEKCDQHVALHDLFSKTDVEQRIDGLKSKIDRLLDARNETNSSLNKQSIDQQLSEHSKQLFIFEA